MKSKLKSIFLFALIFCVASAAGAGATWWSLKPKSEKPVVDASNQKYVNLEKVIVMLRRGNSEATQHYLAVDLVFRTTEDKEKLVKSHLPMLRSETVKALSTYSMDAAEKMTVDQLATEIDRILNERYTRDREVRPFSEVMIGKLIIE